MKKLENYHSFDKIVLGILFILLIISIVPQMIVHAAGELSITPITWDVIGLDSNDETVGPNTFPVGARVCNIGDQIVTNVTSDFEWTTNPSPNYIEIRSNTNAAYTASGVDLAPTECVDFYYEVEVDRVAVAKGTSRGYKINAAADGGLTASTPEDRQLYVEWLISQSRNSVDDVQVDGVSIPNGGTLALNVGETYEITLIGGTATQGYNQLESFINFPNTVFQILSVQTQYAVGGTSDTLYADACGWENDINDPNYNSCVVSNDKAGGSPIQTTYQVKILSSSAVNPEPISTLLYDFSGSSFHYNADFEVSTRYAAIIDPSDFTIAKQFSPNPTNVGGTSKLTFTLSNPSPVVIEGASFTDALPTTPGLMTIASSPGVTTSGCGTPTVTATAGADTISVSDATVTASSSCTISVNVTAPVVGTYDNTTSTLKYEDNGTQIDTGNTASDSLTVDDAPPAPDNICNLNLATWTMEPADGTVSPPVVSYQASDVSTANATIGSGIAGSITGDGNPANQWTLNGFKKGTFSTADNEYVQFAVDTSNYSNIQFFFDQKIKNNGPSTLYIYYSTTGTEPFTQMGAPLSTTSTYQTKQIDFTGVTNTSGVTYFRIYGFDANAENSGLDLDLDNIRIEGCGAPQNITIQKSFSPDAIAVNTVSTLTFNITNPNPITANAVTFSDNLPAGVEVATLPNIQLSNCGSPTFTPLAGATSLDFSNGTILAGQTCTVQVDVIGTAAGPKTNISGFITSSETGTNTNSDGYATDNLTVLLPPEIEKSFSATPIFTNGTSLLTLQITNPNQDDSLTGLAFTDNFPANLTIIDPLTPAATNTCGGTLTANAGASTVTLAGGTLAAGQSCQITVTVTSSIASTYTNTTGAVTSTNAGQGNTASANLIVQEPTPGISFLKEIATSPTGPWTKFVSVTPGTTVYYRFTIENTGDVALTDISVTDPDIDTSSCSFTNPLPFPIATNEDHITTCVSSGVVTTSGETVNTAIANGTYNANNYSSNDSSATYVGAEPAISLVKEISQSATGPWTTSLTGVSPSANLYYRFTVTNTGNVELQSINVTDPQIDMTSCTLTNPLAASASSNCVVGPEAASATIGTYSNTATAHGTYQYDGITYDSSPATASYAIDSPDLIISKTNNVSGSLELGSAFIWEITVTNQGTNSATFAVGEEIFTDTLPAGANYSINTTEPNTSCNLDASNVLTCTPSGTSLILNPTDTATFSISVTPTALGTLSNTAYVDNDSLITESDETNNSDTDDVTVTSSSDLTITKTNTVSDAVVLGDSFTWTIILTNSGSGAAQFAATETVLSDPLPSGATYAINTAPASLNCAIDGSDNLTCTVPSGTLSIPSASTLTVTIDVTPTQIGNLANTVTADPDDVITESNETNNTGSNTVAVSAPNLTITKTNTVSDAVVLGDSFIWTMTITNAGNSPATFDTDDVFLSDTLPLGATYALASSYPTNVSCEIVDGLTPSDPKTFTCKTNAPLSIANASTLAVDLDVTPTQIGNLANTVTADPDDVITESNETNNTGSNTVAVSAPNLTITKTNTVSDAIVLGDSFTWTMTITNAGNSPATFDTDDVLLSDTLPLGATYALASSYPTDVSCEIVDGLTPSDPKTFTCKATAPLSIANTATLAVDLDVTPTQIGNLANTVTADPDDVITESNESDNIGSNTVAVSAKQIDLALTKTVDNATPSIGNNVIFTLSLENTGVDDASGVTVQDVLPSGYTYVTDSEVGGLDSYNATTGLWTIGTLASGASINLQITASVNASGDYQNIAQVTAANENDSDSTPNNDDGDQSEDDEASASVTIPNVLGIAKQAADITEISAGTYQITYNFVVENFGTTNLTDIQITDDLDSTFAAPTTFTISSLTSTDFTVNPSYDGSVDTNLLAGTDNLLPNTTGSVELIIELIPYTAGPHNNSATASGTHAVLGTVTDLSDDGTDPDGNNNGTPTDDSDPTPVDFGPNIFDPPIGLKWLDADNNPILTWTMVWINDSNIVALDAEAYDEIPVGTVFRDNGISSGYPLPGSAPAGSTNTGVTCVDSSSITTTTNCYYEGPTITYPRGRIVWVGTLGPDLNNSTPNTAVNDIAIQFSVRLDQSAAVSNTAYISADLNGDGDFTDAGEFQAASASASWGSGSVLPESGFPQGQVTSIAQNTNQHSAALTSLTLEINKLDITIPIIGVPQENNQWDVSWIGNQAGWLANTAYPNTQGNAAITAHVYNQQGLPGPFINLKSLQWGDEIIIHQNDQAFVYKVTQNQRTIPEDVTSLAQTDQTTLTLITCQNYNQETNTYQNRIIVTAKLIEIR